MSSSDVQSLLAPLATARFTQWAGLPAGLRLTASDGEPVSLGDLAADAALTHLPDPRPGCAARAWTRDGQLVLVEVAWSRNAPAWPTGPTSLGAPDRRDDVMDGLVGITAGEWVYASRGLAIVTSPDGHHVRHAFGFTPTTTQRYARELRVALATTRHPAGHRWGWRR